MESSSGEQARANVEFVRVRPESLSRTPTQMNESYSKRVTFLALIMDAKDATNSSRRSSRNVPYPTYTQVAIHTVRCDMNCPAATLS